MPIFPIVTPFYPARFCLPSVFKPSIKIIVLRNGTCTHRAGLLFLEQNELSDRGIALEEVPSFDKGVDSLTNGNGDKLMLVPFVHDVCRTLNQGEFEHIADQDFALDNPPIFLAGREGPEDFGELTDRRIAAIKPTDEFLNSNFFDVVPVSSTQEAAELTACGDVPFRVTNQSGVERYGLKIIKQLAHLPMWWKFYGLDSF